MTPRVKWPNPLEWVKVDINNWEYFKKAQYLVIKYPGCLLFFRNRVFIPVEAYEEISYRDILKIKTPTIPYWKKLSSFERREILYKYNTEEYGLNKHPR